MEVQYSEAQAGYHAEVASFAETWERAGAETRGDINVTNFFIMPSTIQRIDQAAVSNSGAFHILVTETQVVWSTITTNVSQCFETPSRAQGDSSYVYTMQGSNAAPVQFAIQGVLSGTAANPGNVGLDIALAGADVNYEKEIVGVVNSNFNEFGTLGQGIFVFTIVRQLETDISAVGESSITDSTHITLTFFDQLITNMMASQTSLSFNVSGLPGASYRLQSTTSMTSGVWLDDTNQAAPSLDGMITVPVSGEAHRFYRSTIE